MIRLKHTLLMNLRILPDPVDVTGSFEECQAIDEVVIPKFSDDILSEILGELSLSVSTLNAFLKCPLSFYFNKGLKLPSETNEAMVFGSIIHEVLEKYIFLWMIRKVQN